MAAVAAVGAALDFGVSLWNAYEDRKVQKEQNAIIKQQVELSEKEYYANQQRIQDWNEKYGSVEENLMTYVKGLDASTLYGRLDGSISRTFENSRKAMDSHLASRGFDVAGGVTAGMFQQLADQESQTKLQHQLKAEEYVAGQQQNLLSHNPQPNTPSTANMSNALTNQINTIGTQRAGTARALGQITSDIGAGVSAYNEDTAYNDWKAKQLASKTVPLTNTNTSKEAKR